MQNLRKKINEIIINYTKQLDIDYQFTDESDVRTITEKILKLFSKELMKVQSMIPRDRVEIGENKEGEKVIANLRGQTAVKVEIPNAPSYDPEEPINGIIIPFVYDIAERVNEIIDIINNHLTT